MTPPVKEKKARRGRPPKPLEDKVWKLPRPIIRPIRTYSQRRKTEVLMYLLNHRVPLEKNIFDEWLKPAPSQMPRGMPNDVEEGFRRPFLREVADHFKITSGGTISGWWQRHHKSILKAAGIEPPKEKEKEPAAKNRAANRGQQQGEHDVQGEQNVLEEQDGDDEQDDVQAGQDALHELSGISN